MLAAMAAFAAALAAKGVEPVIILWWMAIAGAGLIAVAAIWSREARFALAGLLVGVVVFGGLGAAIFWHYGAGSGFEKLVRFLAVAGGVAIGIVVGALTGWAWALRHQPQ